MAFNPDPHGKLAGVEPHLVACVHAAAQTCEQPFEVIQGLRTAAEQAALYAQGRTTPGNIVTWVRVSNHEAKPDGFGHAVDLAAIEPSGAIDWVGPGSYDKIKEAMFAAAASCGIVLRWGADWNMTGARERGDSDQDHFEIHAFLPAPAFSAPASEPPAAPAA